MGGVKVGDDQSPGPGKSGLFQAKFRGAMTPTAALLVFLLGVLTITNQQIGSRGHFHQGAVGRRLGLIVGGKDHGSSGMVQPVSQTSPRMADGG